MHLATAINNRALLWGCLGDRERMIADMERGVSIARALGQDSLELIARYNLGEYLYLAGRSRRGRPPRAVAPWTSSTASAATPAAPWWCCSTRASATTAATSWPRAPSSTGSARARPRPRPPANPTRSWSLRRTSSARPSSPATQDAGAPAWDELEERSARFSVGQEQVEVLEMRGLSALRGGRHGEAAAALEKAIAAAARIPNVMGARLRRRLGEATRASGSHPKAG